MINPIPLSNILISYIDTGADSKTLAEMFKLRKNQLVQRLNDKNKGSSGANKAFKEIDKQELYQKRR